MLSQIRGSPTVVSAPSFPFHVCGRNLRAVVVSSSLLPSGHTAPLLFSGAGIPLTDITCAIVGHFEQRISFGYDALLAQVRAEFDGEHLQVIVPRRVIPMTYHPARE